MFVGNETSAWAAQYDRTATSARNKAIPAHSSEPGTSLLSESLYGDSVSISDEARALQDRANVATLDESMQELKLGLNGTALQRYLGTAPTDLTALNHSRKSIGSRIDSIIRGLGIKLGKDEKFAITVDGKNQIKVSGIKDKARTEKIVKALNSDLNLGREMRKLSVNGKLGQYAKDMRNYEKDYAGFSDAIGQDVEAAFSSPGMRSFIMEEYLQDNAGVSLSDLSVERGADGTVSIAGQTSGLNALLTEDPALADTIVDIIDSGEVNSGFSATFEFANGTISDSTTTDEAEKKIKKVETYLLGGVDPDTNEAVAGILPTRLEMIQNNTDDLDGELVKAMGRGFKLQVAANGEFEIIGLDNLDPKYKQMLEGIVQEALNLAANQEGQTNNFADVADAYIEQHQFEHGDTQEYAHMMEINIGGGSHTTKVVSPEADKAQDAKNQETAGELGDKLKDMMGQEGIDTTGMELEIDDSGKIKVLGGVSEEEIQKAQAFVDNFAQEAKSEGADAEKAAKEEEKKTKDEMAKKRRAEVYGDGAAEEGDHVPEGFAARDVVAASDTAEARHQAWRADLTEKVKHLLPDPTLREEGSRETLETFLSWQEYMPGNREEPNLTNNARFETSKLGGPAFGGKGDVQYDDEATRLYHELLDGMKNFHDDRKNVRYTMSSAAAAEAA